MACCLVLLLAAAAAVAQDLPNLLANAGFEAVDGAGWATDWVIWPGNLPETGAVSIDGTVAHTGQRSLRLRHTDASSYTRGQQSIILEPNQRYAFSAWVKGEGITPGPGSMKARLYIEGIGGQDHASEGLFGTFDWQQVLVGPYGSGAGGRITVMCYLHQATGTVWFDDLQAFKVTPEWEQQMERTRLRKGLEAQVRLAEDAARAAGDKTAQAELEAFRAKAAGAETPQAPDRRQGPPYGPVDAELFSIIARMNSRRLGGRSDVVAWQADPFVAVPVVGVVPEKRELPATLLAGSDEREQAAINLCNGGAKPLKVSVSVSGFGGAKAPRLVLREAVHVETAPGRFIADPLPRLRADSGGVLSMSLPPGVFRQLWCDISTTGCPPGEYSAQVQIAAPGIKPVICPIRLRVLPVTFPAVAPIATWNYSYMHWPLIKDRWPQAAADLTAHHINSYCWPSDTLPWPKFGDDGTLQPLDWTNLDRALAAHGPVKWLLLWPGFDWPNNVALRQDLEPGTPLWEQRFVAWFRAMIAGLKERGFGYDRVAWYLRDEPTTFPTAQVVAMTGAAVHKADPQALVVANPYDAATQPMLDLMAPAVDIWCPMLSWARGDLLKWFQDQSRKSGILWSYQVLSKDRDAFLDYRLSFWDCWRKGISGQGFWCYADGDPDNWSPYGTNRALYGTVYGGDEEELIPSRRWEAWREGTEDYTYLWMLRQAQPDNAMLGDPVRRLADAPTPEGLATLRAKVLAALAKR